jgi:hypothetical protein
MSIDTWIKNNKTFFVFFRDRVSLYRPGCPGTHSVDQAGLELRNLPTSASRVLGLKACSTKPGFNKAYDWSFICVQEGHQLLLPENSLIKIVVVVSLAPTQKAVIPPPPPPFFFFFFFWHVPTLQQIPYKPRHTWMCIFSISSCRPTFIISGYFRLLLPKTSICIACHTGVTLKQHLGGWVAMTDVYNL